MDIPETEKLDVNAPSALSDPTISLSFSLPLPVSLSSLSLSLSLLRMALAQRSMENHGGPFLPFSAGGREERKKKQSR